MKTIYPETQRLYNPNIHHVGLSKKLLDLKRKMIMDSRNISVEKETIKELK